jgi:tetratricopeptide (TPR) repeat protein
MLATNNWERPIYWAITVGTSKYMNLQDYFQLEGFAYRFVPIKAENQPDRLQFGSVNTDAMYENLMNKFKWGNMDDPKVYIDENNLRMMTNMRNNFNRLAGALFDEGKNSKAIEVLDRCMKLVPANRAPYEYFALDMAETYLKAGAKEKGESILKDALKAFNDDLSYFASMGRKFYSGGDVNEEIQRTLFFLQKLERAASNSGNTALAKEVVDTYNTHAAKFGFN